MEADKACFGALTRAAAKKVKDHSPAAVIPIIFGAGGALRACDNDLLAGHWMRVELGTILMKFAFTISVQLRSRRDSCIAAWFRCRKYGSLIQPCG